MLVLLVLKHVFDLSKLNRFKECIINVNIGVLRPIQNP